MSNIAQIDDDGLDTIALAFNLGLETLHLVTVEAVGDILAMSDRVHILKLRTYPTDVKILSHDEVILRLTDSLRVYRYLNIKQRNSSRIRHAVNGLCLGPRMVVRLCRSL